jgi:uncharacterized protein
MKALRSGPFARLFLFIAAAAALACAARAQEMPGPGLEMDKLKFLVGEWEVNAEYLKTPMIPNGGKATGWYKARLGPDGFSIIADFGSEGPLGPEIGHEVISWDPKQNVYIGSTSGNFPGMVLSRQHWDGDNLIADSEFDTGSAKLQLRSVYVKVQPNAASVHIEESFRMGDAPYQLMYKADAVKKDAKAATNPETRAEGANMPHPVVHFEIGCKDSKKTQEFYSALFGWKIQEAGPAAMIDTGGGITGHITALGHEPSHYTIFYVEVEDVQAYLNKAKGLGAETLVGPIDIPTGTFAWIRDPEGNTVALWKTKK